MRGATCAVGFPAAPDVNFNPRAPCGARPVRKAVRFLKTIFQSTRPMRGATGGELKDIRDLHISIHAPHAGRDNIVCTLRYS